MASVRHGLSIGIERIDSDFFLTVKVVGTLQHSDYDIIVPMIDSALDGVKDPEINVFVDATQLEGWALRAAWDDLLLGFKHGGKFNKTAIVGNKQWQAVGAKIGSWFISGQVKYFEHEREALQWLRDLS